MKYVSYDQQGKILKTGFSINAQNPEFHAREAGTILVIDDADNYVSTTHWVNGGVVQLRVNCPAVLTGQVLTNVPVPARIQVEDAWYDTTDALVELELPYPGSYPVRVEAFPYLDAVFEVIV